MAQVLSVAESINWRHSSDFRKMSNATNLIYPPPLDACPLSLLTVSFPWTVFFSGGRHSHGQKTVKFLVHSATKIFLYSHFLDNGITYLFGCPWYSQHTPPTPDFKSLIRFLSLIFTVQISQLHKTIEKTRCRSKC